MSRRTGKMERYRSLAFCERMASKLQIESMLLWQAAQAAGDTEQAAELWAVSRSACEALARLERLKAKPAKQWAPRTLTPIPPPGPLDVDGVPAKRTAPTLAQLLAEATKQAGLVQGRLPPCR